jgi:hypothetical protein
MPIVPRRQFRRKGQMGNDLDFAIGLLIKWAQNEVHADKADDAVFIGRRRSRIRPALHLSTHKICLCFAAESAWVRRTEFIPFAVRGANRTE